jgi:hypothetical protein
MRTNPHADAMARELREHGFDAEQGQRHAFAFGAAKLAVLALLCAKFGAAEVEMLEALMDSRSLNDEVARLLGRIEVSPAYVGYIHSGLRF